MIFNRHALAVYTLDDADLEREVVELFIGQLDDLLAALRGATDAGAWHGVLHALRGSAATVGAEHIVDACDGGDALVHCPPTLSRRDCMWLVPIAADRDLAQRRAIAATAAAIAAFVANWRLAAVSRAVTAPQPLEFGSAGG